MLARKKSSIVYSRKAEVVAEIIDHTAQGKRLSRVKHMT